MSEVEIKPLDLYEKDPNEKRVILFDWDDANLAASVTISTSTFTITVERPTSETVSELTSDNATIVSGSRKTQVRVLGGEVGSLYRLTNHITTNESPAQEKERSVFVSVVDQ